MESGTNGVNSDQNAKLSGFAGELSGSFSSDDQEDLEDEIEPRLKYERMSNSLTTILSRDAASCLSVHSKFMAVGTQWGSLFVMDLVGNVIENVVELLPHSTTVNQISIDNSGEYLASCSEDGKVIINGLYTKEDNQVVNFDRPIKSVAIDPNFGKSGSGKQFVAGETKLFLYEKGFLGRQKSVLLYENNKVIETIKWQSTFIAWSTSQGVHVYDTGIKKRISFIPRHVQDKSNSDKDLGKCTLYWKDNVTLIIVRLNVIQVCVVKDSMATSRDTKPALTRYVEIIAMKVLDFIIAGLCPYNDTYVVLSYSDCCINSKMTTSTPGRPHLRIINSTNGDEISNDALSIKGFQSYKCTDYHLESCPEEGMFFVVSPKDIVVARQRDEDDHLDWLIEHEEFQEALNFATKNSKFLKKRTCQDVGFQWFNSLFEEKKFGEAANLCPKLFGRNKELWESYIIRFKQFNELAAIASVIPVENPRLDRSTYEMVLYEFLALKKESLFMELIKKWDSKLFDVEEMISEVMNMLERDRNNVYLLESLGHLYTKDGKHEKAFYIYVKLGHTDIFEMIKKHNLFEDVGNHVVTLMDFNSKATVALLIENLTKIPAVKVIPQLKDHPLYLLAYLSQLIKKDQYVGQEYHQTLVELYADHDQAKLLPFLMTSSFISLQQSLDLCKKKQFVKERIYLLDRMGNSREALRVMLLHESDVDAAIDFCKHHSDADLWQDLIQHSIDKPEFIIGLLNNIGGHLDPILLIRQIKEKMEIPGLRDSLVRIINDYNQQVYFQERCCELASADCLQTFNDLLTLQKLPIRIDETSKCTDCKRGFLCNSNNQENESELLVFRCHHFFHYSCVYFDESGSPGCSVCYIRKSPNSVHSSSAFS